MKKFLDGDEKKIAKFIEFLGRDFATSLFDINDSRPADTQIIGNILLGKMKFFSCAPNPCI